MPPPFRPLTIDGFADEVASYAWRRPIFRVDMHHTWYPAHADWKGEGSVSGMCRFHTQERGFDDIAQHVTIAPDGMIWTGRDWNKIPASVGCNMNAGVFMFEAIGNFDTGNDRLDGDQFDAVVAVIDIIQQHFCLPVQCLLFHRDVPQTTKTCPGTSIDKFDILAAVAARRRSMALTA
ncbi:MAG: peptidoglycan recognition family protein [Hyphomicrobiaceae bacterium]